MKNAFRSLAIALIAGGFLALAATVAFWALSGANSGWTKTYVEIHKIDPITEIAYSERVERFIPGVEILGAGILGGSVCILAGVVILKRQKP